MEDKCSLVWVVDVVVSLVGRGEESLEVVSFKWFQLLRSASDTQMLIAD